MHITRYTDYSLRVLMYLAVKGDELSTIRDIADSYDISKNHLMKIVQALSSQGYIEAIRGKNGGIRLNADPATLNIGQLVRALENGVWTSSGKLFFESRCLHTGRFGAARSRNRF